MEFLIPCAIDRIAPPPTAIFPQTDFPRIVIVMDNGVVAAHGVSIQQVADAVKNSNIIASPGLVEENHQLGLALALGSGAELLQPLAIAAISSLAVDLLFSLVVIPTVYAMLYREYGGGKTFSPVIDTTYNFFDC